MKLKFKKNALMLSFHDKPDYWYDGDTRMIPDVRARELLKMFPDNFSVVGKQKEAPPENKAVGGEKQKQK